MNYVRCYLVIFGISMLTAFGIYFWLPNYRGYLDKEDSLIENLSAAFYLITFFMGFLFFLKSKMHRKALIFVSAVGLLGFLDELSFGERLFGLKMPRIDGIKIDSAHDFFYLGCVVIKNLTYSYPIYIFLLLSVGVVTVTIILSKYRFKIKKIMSSMYHEHPFILAFFFTILIFIALVIDLNLVRYNVLFMVEELFEMNAAIALLFCCLSLNKQRSSNETSTEPS